MCIRDRRSPRRHARGHGRPRRRRGIGEERVKLHDLKPAPGSRQKRKRVGRGISAGQGKTSGRGQKGQGARESNSVPKGFEGGQMKQSMRLPKLRGFHNRFRREYQVVNLSKLNRFEASAIVDGAALAAAGLVSGPDAPIKLLCLLYTSDAADE